MPHNRLNTKFGLVHRAKHGCTTSSTSASVSKYRLWVARRRASFQTRSIGANCGLYGGRNRSVSTWRYLCSNGASSLAWWYRALSKTMTMLFPLVRRRRSNIKNSSNVLASNVSHKLYANFPVSKLTAPKQAIDLRVGAWVSTGSLTSGGIHIRQRVPCCWKWHSSKLHSSRSFLFARRRSFFKGCHQNRVRLSHLRTRLAQTKSHLPEEALTLAHSKNHVIALLKVRGQQFAIPQVTNMAEIGGAATQVALQRSPLLGIQTGRSSGAFSVAHSLQPVLLKAPDPALYGAPVFPEKISNLLTTLTTRQKQQTVQPMVIPGLVRPGDLLLNGDSHNVGICNFQLPHTDSMQIIRSPQCKSPMRRYICRYV